MRNNTESVSADVAPRKQSGFTLIELMVVTVIMAVVLSVGMISVSPNESGLLRKQVAGFKGALQQACDIAAFKQKVTALVPTKDGLALRVLQKGSWVAGSGAGQKQRQPWQEGMTVTWTLNEAASKQAKLKPAGWMCWPSGEVMEGDIQFKIGASQSTLVWNPVLAFETTHTTLNTDNE